MARAPSQRLACLLGAPALALPGAGHQSGAPRLERVAVIATAAPGAEIASVQASSKRLILTHSRAGSIELFDLSEPARPRSVRVFDLGLEKGEELTSAALPPDGEWFLAAVKAEGPLANGRAVAHSLADGRRLASFPCGVGPDCVAIDPSGRWALVANEAEGFVLEEGELRSAPGSLTRIELAEDVARSTATQIPLSETAGLDDPAGRLLERQLGGETRLVPLKATPDYLEPEVVAFDPSGRSAFVTLQEVNAILRLDVGEARSSALWPLGLCTHPADLAEDGKLEERSTLVARREPDGIAVTPDGRLLVTADEGDTFPRVADTPQGVPCSGGRSVSVFDARTGALLGDTGAQLDRAGAKAGLYPDRRSNEKGSEPEMILALELGGVPFAAVGLERAGAVALIDLREPGRPAVVAIAATGDDPFHDEPEGLAHYRDPSSGRDYIYAANEASGTLGVLLVRP